MLIRAPNLHLFCRFPLILTLDSLLLCEGMTMAFVEHTSSSNQQPRWLQICCTLCEVGHVEPNRSPPISSLTFLLLRQIGS